MYICDNLDGVSFEQNKCYSRGIVVVFLKYDERKLTHCTLLNYSTFWINILLINL